MMSYCTTRKDLVWCEWVELSVVCRRAGSDRVCVWCRPASRARVWPMWVEELVKGDSGHVLRGLWWMRCVIGEVCDMYVHGQVGSEDLRQFGELGGLWFEWFLRFSNTKFALHVIWWAYHNRTCQTTRSVYQYAVTTGGVLNFTSYSGGHHITVTPRLQNSSWTRGVNVHLLWGSKNFKSVIFGLLGGCTF
jgi:hypothetical protein